MDPLKNKYTYLQRLKHQFQARRDIPFRRRFFVGYDLHGNTYWEFTIDGNMQRLRRKMDPYEPLLFKADYFSTVPPQWLQWLRRTRNDPPSLEELINDQVRQAKLKLLAQHADAKWEAERLRLEEEQRLKLNAELQRTEREEREYQEKHQAKKDSLGEYEQSQAKEDKHAQNEADPWKQADESKDANPIELATLKVRRWCK